MLEELEEAAEGALDELRLLLLISCPFPFPSRPFPPLPPTETPKAS